MKITPKKYAEALYRLLKNAAPENHSLIIKNFARLLSKNKNLGLLKKIAAEFENIYFRETGVRRLNLETPKKIDRDEFQQKLGTKFHIEAKTNPALIAGARIKMEDKLIDATLQSRIIRLKRILIP